MKVFCLFAFLILSKDVFAQDQWKNVYTESAWGERDVWQKADTILLKLAIGKGSIVADIGCHEGYMTMKLSRQVGPTGQVYAVDLEPTRLEKLTAHLKARGIENVISVKAELDDPKLPTNTLDAVLILDSYHEMKSHDQILLKIMASLKLGGRLVICEPIAENRRNWSRHEQESKHELSIIFALKDLQKAGFQILFKQDRLVDREKIKGDKMWIIVASR